MGQMSKVDNWMHWSFMQVECKKFVKMVSWVIRKLFARVFFLPLPPHFTGACTNCSNFTYKINVFYLSLYIIYICISVSLSPFIWLYFDLVCHTLSPTHTQMLSCAHLTSCKYANYIITQKYLLLWNKMVHVIRHGFFHISIEFHNRFYFSFYTFFSIDRFLSFPNSMLFFLLIFCLHSMFVRLFVFLQIHIHVYHQFQFIRFRKLY